MIKQEADGSLTRRI